MKKNITTTITTSLAHRNYLKEKIPEIHQQNFMNSLLCRIFYLDGHYLKRNREEYEQTSQTLKVFRTWLYFKSTKKGGKYFRSVGSFLIYIIDRGSSFFFQCAFYNAAVQNVRMSIDNWRTVYSFLFNSMHLTYQFIRLSIKLPYTAQPAKMESFHFAPQPLPSIFFLKGREVSPKSFGDWKELVFFWKLIEGQIQNSDPVALWP